MSRNRYNYNFITLMTTKNPCKKPETN